MTREAKPIPPDTRILVVDDNVDASLIVSMSLKLQGFSVQRGESGPQTLSIAEVWQPHAILLDISMPGMDGYATCRLLRQHVWGQAMVIIALTGYGRAEDHMKSAEAGFDWHLIKPVDLTSLPDLLIELIDQKKTRLTLK